jgi:hypothetical protein
MNKHNIDVKNTNLMLGDFRDTMNTIVKQGDWNPSQKKMKSMRPKHSETMAEERFSLPKLKGASPSVS